jgi:hypothetical protein
MNTTRHYQNNDFNFSISKKDIFQYIKDIITNKDNNTTVLVPHVCSINATKTSKFASVAYKHYPIVQQNYTLSKTKKMGTTQFIEAYTNNKTKNSIIFANMICENSINIPKNNSRIRLINYGALALCMFDVSAFIRNYLKNNTDHNVQIHAPKFGTGFAGGDWKVIGSLISDIWNNQTTYIYEPN